jgi:phytoene dehydrogenase-like protein
MTQTKIISTDPDLSTVDAIFVGAGINALAAAFLLGRAGWRVLVVDRNEEPGGSIRTQALTLPGFHHDIGAMNLNLFVGSPFYQEHKEELARNGADFVIADRSVGSVFPDGRFLGITMNSVETSRAIGDFSKPDAEAWADWSADFERCAPFLFQIFGSPAATAGSSDYPFGDMADVPVDIQPVLKGILLNSQRENLTARFESTEIQAMIAAWGLHLDYAPDIDGGCFFPFLETNIDARNGISLAKGGSGRLIESLVALVRETGGEVRCAASVEKIVLEDGRAAGVRLEGGEVIKSAKAVVASVTPEALLELTDGHLPEPEMRRARNWRFGPGTMMIHLALSDLPQWQAEGARKSFYIHIGPTLDYMARAYQEGLAGQLSSEPFCVVGQPTLFDPSRAPTGKHVLWVMVRCVPATIKGDAAGEISGRSWTPDVKEAFADRVLNVIEGYAPGLRKFVLARTIHAPTDLEALNPNLVGGDLVAGSAHLDQFYGQRPFPGYAHHKMPIPGLYMCGASTWPGGGAGTGSGTLVAGSLLEDNPTT